MSGSKAGKVAKPNMLNASATHISATVRPADKAVRAMCPDP
jgi:hypothetical protein